MFRSLGEGGLNDFSVILPVRNQADHVAQAAQEYVRVLSASNLSGEILLVPNGCSDDTVQICRQLERSFESIRVIEVPRAGWGLAVLSGIENARGQVVCFTNLARTNPGDVVTFICQVIRDPECVLKAKRLYRDNWVRRLGSKIYNLEVRLLFRLSLNDVNGTPKAFSRNHASLFQLSEEGDLLDLEFMVKCRNANIRVTEIGVSPLRRLGGSSTTGFVSATKIYTGALKLGIVSRLKIQHSKHSS